MPSIETAVSLQPPGAHLRHAAATDLLPFIESVVARYLPPGSVERQTVDGMLARLHQRLDDPALYLAIIGGFNTGKSTLINALIGLPLLKMDGIPTTTTPQTVTYGDRLDLAVTFTDGQHIRSSNQLGRLWRRLRSIDPSIPRRPFKRILRRRQAIEELIELIGADELLTPHIQSCTISLPSHHLRAGLAIIDTPGVNSTNEDHRRTALRAINERADLILVTAPAQLQIQDDFDRFLQQHVQPYLSRCLFVATRGDDVPASELNGAEKRIRRQIRDLNGDDTRFLTTAALPALKAATGVRDLTPTDHEWVRRFDESRQTIMSMMEAEQIAAIQETIERLTQTLATSVAATLEQQIAAWEKQAEDLRRDAIDNLDVYAEEAKTLLTDDIQRATIEQEGRLLTAINSARSAAISSIGTDISNARTEKEMDAIAANQVAPTVQTTFGPLAEQTKAAQREVHKAGDEAEKSFVKSFSETFRKLIAAAGTFTTARPEIHLATLPADVVPSYSLDLSTVFAGVKDRGIRGILRKIVRGEKQRQEYRERLRDIVRDTVGDVAAKYTEQVRGAMSQLQTALNRHGDELVTAHVEHYRKVYNDILDQQRKAREEVERHRRETETTLTELRQRQAKVFGERSNRNGTD